MSEEFEQSPQAKAEATKREYSEALLQSAIERIKARGDSSRRMACMSLPAGVFHDLCARLMEGGSTVRGTAEWLAGQAEDAPTRSSVERFSDVLYEEYRLAELAMCRRQGERYAAEIAGNDPVAQAMVLNSCLTERLTDEFLRANDAGPMEVERFETLIKGVRTVNMTAMDKQKMDARLAALVTLNKKMEAEIALKEQKLQAAAEQLKAEEKKRAGALAAAEKVAAGGGGADAVVNKVRELLGIAA